MKKLFKILAAILVVLVVLAIPLLIWLDAVVLKTFNAAAPAALGVPATLQKASFRPLRGKASLKGLHIGNPEGYKTDGLLDLASVSVDLDTSSLLSDTIIIDKIAIDGLVVTYEKGLLNSNLGALLDSLSSGEEKPKEDEAKEEQTAEKKPGKKVVIKKLMISDSKMVFSITGAAALTGGGGLPIPLPAITLTDLGQEEEGVTVVEAIQRVLKAIAGATGTAIAGSGKLIGKGVGAVGEGAMAVGEGAVDAGKAVVGGVGDAGKAVVGGVGDALHAVNPFKK
jgi:uncharacterized protein involved in outer membrane biogenesis